MITDLGHQTVQRIVRASDPLQSMQDINQNFPNIVSSLSRMKVNYLVTFCWTLKHKTLYSKIIVYFILMELWHATAWWFCSRWNNGKPKDDPTWQVFNGSQWCSSQCWRDWPLSVMFFFSPADIIFIIMLRYYLFFVFHFTPVFVAWGYCFYLISIIWKFCCEHWKI